MLRQWGGGREPNLSRELVGQRKTAKPTLYGGTTSIESGPAPGVGRGCMMWPLTIKEGCGTRERGQGRDGILEHLSQAICSVVHNWEGRDQITNEKQLIQSPVGTAIDKAPGPHSVRT